MSDAQKRYVAHWCKVLREGLEAAEETDVVIDMDAVADATDQHGERPEFYVSEESQQHQFVCSACETCNDIIGRYGYCGVCGTRNDCQDFEQSIERIRNSLNKGAEPEDSLKDAVSEFESFIDQTVAELAELATISSHRKNRLAGRRFHNIEEVSTIFAQWFDIDIRNGVSEQEWIDVLKKFCRRHVYEHKGGVVDQRYLDDSGDTTVRLRQRIGEQKEDIHAFMGRLVRIARNVHSGFHDLFPPEEDPIKRLEEKKQRLANRRG